MLAAPPHTHHTVAPGGSRLSAPLASRLPGFWLSAFAALGSGSRALALGLSALGLREYTHITRSSSGL